MTTKAAIYCRISDDREGLGLGVKRQEEDCRALAKRNGWEVVEVFTDNDVSAFSGRKRPKYLELIQRIKAGEFNVLIAWHNDRLHRSPRELEDFITLCEEAKLEIQTVNAGHYDLTTSSGRATARILGAVARQSSEQSSERIKRKALEVAMAGKPWGGSSRPFGYAQNKIDLVESEAEVIRTVTSRFLAGESLYSLCRWLDAQEIRTSSGTVFKPKALKQILNSPRISGRASYKGEILGKAIWPAIISVEESDAIRSVLESRVPKNPVARKYLLTGLLTCDTCGRTLVSNSKNGHGRFICRKNSITKEGCGSTYITASHVEKFVTEAVLTRLNSPALEKKIKSKTNSSKELSARMELMAVEERGVELAEMFAKGEMSRSEFVAAKKVSEKKKAELERTLSREVSAVLLDSQIESPKLIASKWKDLNLDRQRTIIKAVLETVRVRKVGGGTNSFDFRRLDLIWKY
jgi:DNA invertase Pin-like site-specific DNA recombinase